MQSNWTLEYSPRMIKRMDKIKSKGVIKTILKKAKSLETHPHQCKLLSGKAGKEGLHSLRFGTPYGEMRLLYKLIDETKTILLVYVDTREEIYKLLERWIS